MSFFAIRLKTVGSRTEPRPQLTTNKKRQEKKNLLSFVLFIEREYHTISNPNSFFKRLKSGFISCM